MKRIHLERGSDLLRALIVIKEDSSSEKQKQEKMARRLKGKRMDEKDEEDEGGEAAEEKSGSEEATGAEAGEKEADKQKPATDTAKKGEKLPGAKRLEDAELKQGQSPTAKDIIQRINFVRAGASLKDEKVKNDISTWLTQLREPERLAVYTTLDALAKIVLGRKSAAEAPTFSSPNNLEIRDTEPDSAPPSSAPKLSSPVLAKKKAVGPVPITVGEGVVKKLKEIDVPVRSGRVVPFGSKSHVSDIENRIEDLKRIRSYQERGSDTHHALGLAIAALKKQLASAYRTNGSGNPRTQPVPPIVEKRK